MEHHFTEDHAAKLPSNLNAGISQRQRVETIEQPEAFALGNTAKRHISHIPLDEMRHMYCITLQGHALDLVQGLVVLNP